MNSESPKPARVRRETAHDSPATRRERIDWETIESDPHDSRLLLELRELGGELRDMADGLLTYGKRLSEWHLSPPERERALLRLSANLKNRVQYAHGNLGGFVARLSQAQPTDSETAADIRMKARSFAFAHFPTRAWQHDRESVAVCIYLLDEGRATPNQIRSVLESLMGTKLPSNLVYDRLAPRRRGAAEHSHTFTPSQDRERRAKLIERLRAGLKQPLTPAELENGARSGALLLGGLAAEAYTPETSWKRDEHIRALVAQLIDRNIAPLDILEILEYGFGITSDRATIDSTTSARLRQGLTGERLLWADSEADEAMRILESVSALKGTERIAHIRHAWGQWRQRHSVPHG